MNQNKLSKVRIIISQLRGSAANVRHRQLVSVATKLGRVRDGSRGKEPTFVNEEKGWNPLSIPDHPKALRMGTVHNILDSLEEDVLAWEEELSNSEEQ